MKASVEFKMVTNVIEIIDKNFVRGNKGKDYLLSTGYELENVIKTSFGKSPSAPGDPPGVDTGRLRASITTSWTGGPANGGDGVSPPSDDGQFTVVVGTAVPYAVYLEYGTRKMAARPYFRPALLSLKR